MRPGVVWTIFIKELRDSLRDRRTLIMMVGLPVVLYPLLILGGAQLAEMQQESSEERVSKVAVWGEAPEALREELSGAEKITLQEGLAAPEEIPPAEGDEPEPGEALTGRARQAILNRQVEAILLVWPGAAEAVGNEGLAHVSVFFDSVRPDSRKARDRLWELVRDYRDSVLEERVERRGLGEKFARPVELHTEDVASRSRRTGMFLGSVLGFMLVLVSAMGGLYAAIDLTAGEKERGTMETLLCAPVTSVEIIGGKFLAVWAISLVASGANVASMGLAMSRITIGAMELQMTVGSYLLSLLFLVPITFMLSAVFLAVAVFAKDFKDGQNYLTPVMMGLLLPLGIVSMPNIELNQFTAFIPVANITLLIKAVFLGEAKADGIFLTMLASCLYAALAVVAAAKVFERETVLLSGRMSFQEMFRIERRPGETPSATTALVLYAGVLVLGFYASVLLVKLGILPMLLTLQYGIFLAPALVVAAVIGYSPVKTFSLRLPDWKGLVGAALIGVSAWMVGMGVFTRLLPVPESLTKALEKVLLIDDKELPLVVLWLVVALTPGICEELMFRGFIQSSLRRYGMWPAIGVTALLFGFAHGSIYRLMPSVFLGVLAGYAVWRTRSVVTGVVIHALSNGLAVSIARSEELQTFMGLKDAQMVPWSYAIGGTAVMVVGLLLIRSVEED